MLVTVELARTAKLPAVPRGTGNWAHRQAENVAQRKSPPNLLMKPSLLPYEISLIADISPVVNILAVFLSCLLFENDGEAAAGAAYPDRNPASRIGSDLDDLWNIYLPEPDLYANSCLQRAAGGS
jgi:hypothetical protein